VLGGVEGLVHHPKPLAEYILSSLLDPEAVKYAWERMLAAAGVETLYHGTISGAMLDGDIVTGALVESVAGRAAISARRVIDCSGDAALCAAAGARWDKVVMACVFRSYISGVTHRDEQLGERKVPHGRTYLAPAVYNIDPLDPWDLTRGAREGRRAVWEEVGRLRSSVPEQKNAFVETTPNALAVRASRCVRGLAQLTEQDVWEFRKHADGIARGSWDVDIYDPEAYQGYSVARHTPEYQSHIKRLVAGDYYDVPYGALVVQGLDNLLVAGRCLSADPVAQSSIRIQQSCMSTGEAAGTAAAMSIDQGLTPRELDGREVAAKLKAERAQVEPAFDELKRLRRSQDIQEPVEAPGVSR
jgi:hypothetical protein